MRPTEASLFEEPRPVGTVVIAVILAVGALYLGREFFVPIALALLFRALLRPLVRTLERVRVPAPFGAALVVFGMLALVGVGGWAVSEPVQTWVAKAPASLAAAQAKVRKLRRPFQQLTKATSGEGRAFAETDPRLREADTRAQLPRPKPRGRRSSYRGPRQRRPAWAQARPLLRPD